MEGREKAKKEIDNIQKELQDEIKYWKKELGLERTVRINVEKRKVQLSPKVVQISSKSELSEVTHQESQELVECTLCAEPIENFVPVLFSGTEMNAACDLCRGDN